MSTTEIILERDALKRQLDALRNAINYPAEWDTAVYPTLLSALQEIYACKLQESK